MPTRDRRRFVGQAIWYFLKQDYSPRELIVVDDGDDPVADLVPKDPRIRYVRLSEQLSTAAKRNRGCQAAAGELIVHWEDDAWYSSDRLSTQVGQFQDERVEAAALTGMLHYQPLTGRSWRYQAPAETTARVHAASVAYRRTFWDAHRFCEQTRDEVASFIRETPRDQLDLRDGLEVAVAVLHGSSTGVVNPADVRWQPRTFEELGRLLKLDLRFYAGLRANARAARRRSLASITLAATFMVYDGYGSMAEYLALGMARSGAHVHIVPFRIDPEGMSPEFTELWRGSRPDPDGIVLCHAWWGENLARFGAARDLFVKTAWETSALPADWPARLNQATAVFVPSRFAARVLRESGVRVPVEVVHEGVDPDVYPYQVRPERKGLTTLVVGVLAPRKNFRQAIEAWKLAFADDPDARLILKARFQLEPYSPDDPRIEVVDRNEATRGILHWYRDADILLALGNEGFGLPLVEGMATGLPAVALDSEAQGDVCAEAQRMLLPVPPVAWEPVHSPLFGACGVRAIPDVEAAASRLRWIAEHRAEAREMGRRGSAWAHARRNVWNLGPATLDAIERHARCTRPLRPRDAMWIASGSHRHGLGYYVDDLTRTLSRVRVHETPPVAWRSASLHIQHTPGLFDDAELAAQVHAARQNGSAIVITEHCVGATAAAWEQLADVLVALDGDGAARLSERWSDKRVEVIPPGCPVWRRPTRDGTGRRVALIAAGQLDMALLARLRSLPDIELVVLCAQPPRGCEPLPPSSDALAQRLNEDADVALVVGSEVSRTATSYLARIAVASGASVVLPAADGHADLAAVSVQFDDPAAGVLDVLERPRRRSEFADAAREFCQQAGWPQVAALHHALWRTLA